VGVAALLIGVPLFLCLVDWVFDSEVDGEIVEMDTDDIED
jgi:hypothetical protein